MIHKIEYTTIDCCVQKFYLYFFQMQECLNLQPEEDAILDFDAIERWTVMHCPLFDKIFLYVLAASFGLDAGNDEFCLLPTQGEQLMVLV